MPPVCTTRSGWRSGSLCVTVAGEEVNSANPDLVVRTLTLESLVDQETDAVKMLHFTGWPEKGIYVELHTPSSNDLKCQLYYIHSLSIITLFHCCFHNSLRYSSECQGHCTDVSEGPLNPGTAANQICECFAIVLASPPSHPHTLTACGRGERARCREVWVLLHSGRGTPADDIIITSAKLLGGGIQYRRLGTLFH